MSSKGIWLTVLMRSAHFNSLTHFDVAQQPLLLHIPCYGIGGGTESEIPLSLSILQQSSGERNVGLSTATLPLTFAAWRSCRHQKFN